MSTQRETETQLDDSNDDDLRRRPPEEIEETPEGAPDDNEPDLEVNTDEHGTTTVQSSGLTKAQRREQKFKERFGNHFKEFAGPLEQQLAQQSRTIGELAALLRQNHQQQQQAPAPRTQEQQNEEDFYDQITKKQELILAQARTPGLSSQQQELLTKEFHRLQRELLNTHTESAIKKALKDYRPPEQMNPHVAMLQAKYGDVFANDAARNWAWRNFQNMRDEAVLAGNQAFDVAKAHEDSLTEAAYKFGLRKRPASIPSKAQRARFGGSTASNSEPAKGGGFMRELTKEEKEVALMTFKSRPDMTEAQKYVAFAKRLQKAGYFDKDDDAS